jgi:hypothetical protein
MNYLPAGYRRGTLRGWIRWKLSDTSNLYQLKIMSNMWMFKVAIGIFALPLLMLGIRGIVTKKPFIVSLRHFVLIISIPVLIAAADGLIFSGWLIFYSPFNALGFAGIGPLIIFLLVFGVIFLLVFGVMFLILWKQTEGYSALGVTDESFQDSLRSALNKLNLPFEETIFRIRLTSIEADLYASVYSSLGCAQLIIKHPGHRSTLKSIVDAMNDYFKTVPCKTNMTTNVYFIILGALAIITAVYIEL